MRGSDRRGVDFDLVTGATFSGSEGRLGRAPLVRFRRGDQQLSEVMPPFFLGATTGRRILGLDLDVLWTVSDCQDRGFTWVQLFRDGVEQARSPTTAQLSVEMAMSYAEMLRVLYRAAPLESALPAARLLESFEVFSCLAGLFQDGSVTRMRNPPACLDLLVER